ncbi:thiolase-like protein [Aspergillus floccosus]
MSDGAPVHMDGRLRMVLNRWERTCTNIISAALDQQAYNPSATLDAEVRAGLHLILEFGSLALQSDPVYVYTHAPLQPTVNVSRSGELEYLERPREAHSYTEVVRQKSKTPIGKDAAPFAHIRTRQMGGDWEYDPRVTGLLHSVLDVGASKGLNFADKTALVTGAGPDSIGAQVVEGLLTGGARVIVTTSRPISESSAFFQHIYREHGARGSSLTVLPMNQASKRDCQALIKYIYTNPSVTGGDLDYVLPFAAIPQAGELDSLNGRHEVALRAMLVNIMRLVGCIRREKEKRRIDTRPTMFVLPMSCNEGTFGGDGLYAESKIALKTLFNRFFSESWSTYITFCGAVIGWTRGTGLMRSTNMIAEEMEKLGLLTFTQQEMAFNILALMAPAITELAEAAPVYADLTGGFDHLWRIKDEIIKARKRVADRLQLHKVLAEEEARHQQVLFGQNDRQREQAQVQKCRANLSLHLPSLLSRHDVVSGLANIEGMIDLSTTVVVAGFSELGPWGNARTRWDMEHRGDFTLEGYIEMAWMMGLIKHVDGVLSGEPYVGWTDAETQTPVRDDEIPNRYRDRIMANSGVRIITPEGLDGYHPSRKEFLHEVAVEEDLPPFESSKSNAKALKLRHGHNVAIELIPGSENYRVYVRKGAILMIPKTIPFSQIAAGTIPTGWDPSRYGIPGEIIQQVDMTTLYALCCVSEAFLSAGIKDPYEIYEHIHVSELANCLGTGGGPMRVIQSIYRDRYLDRQVRGDIILEHFLNTMGAWVNMLLLSGSGPLKTPVGACATALESLDIGCEAIQSGKCQVAVVGGCDDYREELAYEFANIKATANSSEELATGRLPKEISRPTASSRSGFAESSGCGVQILMNAELALKMGVPIYGVVAYSQMASDQVGRSIPAPGKGILTAARESHEGKVSPLLDLEFRRRCFDQEMANIREQCVNDETHNTRPSAPFPHDQVQRLRVRETQQRWANNIRSQLPGIAPMKAALATWGLSIDDIGVVSMHGTSTKANEVNEGDVINTQMEHLGRRHGNPLLSICQKSLTGHPKAAAGAWQMNGCIQMLQGGIVPGNRNADNIDGQLRRYEHLVYPMESIRTRRLKAAILTSFGFGQKGAVSIVVAPRYLFAAVSSGEYEDYRTRARSRQRTINATFVSRILKSSMVQVKDQPPWKEPDAMKRVLLDPDSRVVSEGAPLTTGSSVKPLPSAALDLKTTVSVKQLESSSARKLSNTVQAMIEAASEKAADSSFTSVGVDVEEIASINISNETFLERNFTRAERDYCQNAVNPHASYAGRWCAKEAVFKSLQTASAGAGAAMHDIEIVSENGIPRVIVGIIFSIAGPVLMLLASCQREGCRCGERCQ